MVEYIVSNSILTESRLKSTQYSSPSLLPWTSLYIYTSIICVLPLCLIVRVRNPTFSSLNVTSDYLQNRQKWTTNMEIVLVLTLTHLFTVNHYITTVVTIKCGNKVKILKWLYTFLIFL